MSPKWMKVAAELLDYSADQLSNRCCNDWKWPKTWTKAERLGLATAMVRDNEKVPPDDRLTAHQEEEAQSMASGDYGPPDWWVGRFLAQQLEAHVNG